MLIYLYIVSDSIESECFNPVFQMEEHVLDRVKLREPPYREDHLRPEPLISLLNLLRPMIGDIVAEENKLGTPFFYVWQYLAKHIRVNVAIMEVERFQAVLLGHGCHDPDCTALLLGLVY